MPSAEELARQEREFRALRKKAQEDAAGSAGTACWMRPDDPAWKNLIGPHGTFLCGRTGDGRIIRAGNGHVTIFGTTGSGKGVAIILPNLIHYTGSVLVLDTKGEAAAITAQHRARMGQKIAILDPYNLPGSAHKNAPFWTSYCPFQWLDWEGSAILEDLHLISSLLIIDENGDGKNGFFSDEARSCNTAFAMFMVTMPPELRTFNDHLDLVFGPEPMLKEKIIPLMQKSDAFGGALAMFGNVMAGYTTDMFKNVMATLRRSLTPYVLSPQLRKAMRPSDLNLRDLKERKMTLYVCIPQEKLTSHGRYLRLMLGLALHANTDTRRPDQNLMILGDELASCGPMEQLETGISILRAFGISLVSVFQDVNQLSYLYPKSYQTWIANSDLNIGLRMNDNSTTEYFSKKLGVTTVNSVTDQMERERLRGGTITLTGRSLMTPDEVARLPSDMLMLMFSGQSPILASKLRYYRDKEFFYPDGSPMFDPNPYEKKG